MNDAINFNNIPQFKGVITHMFYIPSKHNFEAFFPFKEIEFDILTMKTNCRTVPTRTNSEYVLILKM